MMSANILTEQTATHSKRTTPLFKHEKQREQLISIPWQPKQKALWDLYDGGPHTWVGYGGSRGGAKSHAARMVQLARRLKYENTNGLIFRKTYGDLNENHIIPLFRQFPFLRQYYNKGEHILTLPWSNSFIVFGYAENHDDIYDFFGQGYADICIDEATDLEQDQIEFLNTCNRCTDNDEILAKMLLTMNPGRIGHSFIKRIFITKEYEDEEDAKDYVFLQAYGWDNVRWCRKALKEDGLTSVDYYSWSEKKRFEYFITRSDYGRKLNKLNESEKKAHLFGDWDVFAGQFFSMWRRDTHIIRTRVDPAQRFTVAGTIDYGQRSVLEMAFRDYEGNVVFFAECYTEHQTPGERFNAMADMLIERKLYKIDIQYDTNMDINLKEYSGLDKTPAAIAKDVFQTRMKDKAPNLTVVSKASTDKRGYRVACNEAWKEFLRINPKTKEPKLKITIDCPWLIKTMPELVHDPDSVDGLDFDQDVGIDDPFDAGKMTLMKLWTPTKPKAAPGWAEQLLQSTKKAKWLPGQG